MSGDRLARFVDRLRGDAYTPRPVGGGFHLWWKGMPDPRDADPMVDVAVTLEVLQEPSVPALYFWALQASFHDSSGARLGAAHTGLQWNHRHAGGRAVNWGGYIEGGGVTGTIGGTVSTLSGIPGDVNTYDFPWRTGAPYRFVIARSAGGWTSTVHDLERGEPTVIRELAIGGDRLAGVVVWTEPFCKGTDPPVAVRWSDPSATRRSGAQVRPMAMDVRYPGGAEWRRTQCDWDGRGFVQATDTRRTVRHGTIVPVPQIGRT